ncbi:MAG: hypothetical protein R2831_11235 [Chitinophagaceae bacterium]
MKGFILHLFLLFVITNVNSQQLILNEKARDLYQSAKNFMNQKDYANAIMVYNQAVNIEPDNLFLRRELAFSYYMVQDLARAEYVIAPLLKLNDADEETFRLACNIYTKKKKIDDAESAINKGIKKFPHSGSLYAEKGNLLNSIKKYKSATEAWEEGVKMDPSYYMNYYYLAKVYSFTKKYLWAILYGETFINLESQSSNTQEIKKIVFESYKYMMAEINHLTLENKTDKFEKGKDFTDACMHVYSQLKNVVTGGIQTDNLIMLRTRFLMEWNKQYALQYPFALFDFQQRMIGNGFFDCYNRWLFGGLDNEKLYKQWAQKFAKNMNEFDIYLRSKKFKPLSNQYYQRS